MKHPWRPAITLVALAVVAWIAILCVTEISSPEQVVLWRDRQALDDIVATNRILSEIVIDEVNWVDVPFEDALTQLEKWIHESSPEAKTIHFEVAESTARQTPITLKFKAVPAKEVVRYLTALNQARPDFRSGGRIDISPFTVPRELVDGWFPTDSSFFHGVDLSQSGAVRERFRSFGIRFPQSHKIEFFPDRGLLKISSDFDTLDLIDASLWSCSAREPTWRHHLSEWWYQTKIRLGLVPAPAPATPAPPLAPDPSGLPTPFKTNPPDPFGR
ncbi:MAG: hypothetical protein GXX91_16400 [Verrucomicrobiaceae bacterium]|nr:hypothetical protein [Verrucomicrobiaceae bacterium]